ncbi:MAG TPA: hypothetical protein VER33_09680 [Polyangiaceae bacterium]|nr:hypothetical protein [Polyangiaceae bacterium]
MKHQTSITVVGISLGMLVGFVGCGDDGDGGGASPDDGTRAGNGGTGNGGSPATAGGVAPAGGNAPLAGSGGSASGSGGQINGSGGGMAWAGDSGSGGDAEGGSPPLAGMGGEAGSGGEDGLPCSPLSTLTFTNQTYSDDGRVRPGEALFSFINSKNDPHAQVLRLTNEGDEPVTVTRVSVGANDLVLPAATAANPAATTAAVFPPSYRQFQLPSAFSVSPATSLPATLAAGDTLDVTVQFLSTQTDPPDRMQNIGGQAVTAALSAATTDGCAKAGLYAIGLWNDSEVEVDPATQLPSNNWARYEPTLGQVIATLGYRVNVGPALTALLNINEMSPPPQPNTLSDEVLVSRFERADAAQPVGLLVAGRFSPPLDMPFGWYAAGEMTVANAQPPAVAPFAVQTVPTPLKVVGTMSSTHASDWDTSNHSIMLLPPLKAGSATSFDPGSSAFGIWAFSFQRSTGGVTSAGVAAPNPANGDFVYTEPTLNIDAAHQHRTRVYPLKDRAGVLVPNSYLIGWEEASNGDYQDYVFVLTNARPAP